MKNLFLLFSFLILASFTVNACPPPPLTVFNLDVDSFYSDNHNSIVDLKRKAKHDEAVKPLENFIYDVAKMSDKYLQDPNKNLIEGSCVNQWILSWAKENALLGEMKSKQAYYERKWMLTGIGLVYAKTRSLMIKEKNLVIESWLKKLADLTIAHSDQFKGTRNNHYYWEGLAVAVVGALTKDQKYIDWSKQVFSNAMERIQKNGSLIEEMSRGKRAIHYHSFAAAPLVFMASIFNFHSEQLNNLVQFTYHSILNPEKIEKQLGIKQEAVSSSNLAWLMIYLRQNPNNEMKNFIKTKSPLYYSKLGGDLTLTNPLESLF